MAENEARYQTAADTFASWRDDVLTGQPPVLYPVGHGELARIEIGPGRVTLLGGPPGDGKTAFTMQMVIDALRLTPTVRALVANVEMPAQVLMDRQLARLSGVDLSIIRRRQLGAEHGDRIDQAMCTLEQLTDRLCFLRPPFNLGNVAASADDFQADIILLDYIQRFSPPGIHNDKRGSVDAMMDYLRQFADNGVALIVVSAVGRTKDNRGRNSYAGEGLNLASFRESSELEFGADDAYMLTRTSEIGGQVILRHLKARHSDPTDIFLNFDRRRQRFTSGTPNSTTAAPCGPLGAALAALWNQTAPATEEDAGED
jgi:replicative DNA helicase